MNEAAAQLCYHLPALLMRRDELFPLARQVVRDSGYQYSKGHSRSQFIAGYHSKLLGGAPVTCSTTNVNGREDDDEDDEDLDDEDEEDMDEEDFDDLNSR